MAMDHDLSLEDQDLLRTIGQLRSDRTPTSDLHQRILDVTRQTPLSIPPTSLPERVIDAVSQPLNRYVDHARRRLSSADLYGLVIDAVLSAELAARAGFQTRPAASLAAETTVIDRLSPFTLVASTFSNPAFAPELMAWAADATSGMKDTMEHSEDFLRHGYTQVRRVLAAIAFANGDIDDQERYVIASSIGGASHLQSDDIRILLKDAETKPTIESLVADIDEPIFLRQLFIDLTVLAILKTDWHADELAAVRQAVDAMNIDPKQQAQFAQAFDLLRDASQDLDELTC